MVSIISPYRQHGSDDLTDARDSALNYYTRRLATALARSMNVTVIAPAGHGHSNSSWVDDGVTVRPSYTRGSPFVALQILVGCLKSRARIIHLEHELFAYGGPFSAITVLVVLRLIRILRRRTVSTIHGVIPLVSIDKEFVRANRVRLWPSAVRFLWRFMIRAVCASSDVVHVHEEQHRNMLRAQYGVTARVQVIPHGIEERAAMSRSDARRLSRLRLTDRDDVVLFFGYLSSYKGVQQLLDAIPTAIARRPSLRFIIAGDVPERLRGHAGTGSRSDAPSCDGKVLRLGFVPQKDIPVVFGAADVVILPYTVAMSSSGPMSIAVGYHRPVLLSKVFDKAHPEAPSMFEPTSAGIAKAVVDFFQTPGIQAQCSAFSEQLLRDRNWSSVAAGVRAMYLSL